MNLLVRLLIFCLAAAAAAPGLAQFKVGGTPELLEPEKAFRFAARALDASSIEVSFAIADGYYMYRDKFRFVLEGAADVRVGTAEVPRGIPYKDQFFGEMEIFRKQVRIRVPVERAAGEARSVRLEVTSQGCADAGVCYVPMESRASIRLAALGDAAGGSAPQEPRPALSIFASDFDIARLFEGSLPLVLASFFGFGLLLTFTPCVLPMIPILSGIIAGEERGMGKLRASALSVAYVLGMAAAYALAGIAAAFSGSLLAAALQNAWVLGAFALLFVGLALSMFGLYELRLPGFVSQPLHSASRRLRGGRVASAAGMGAFSAVIVSPCVAAPLAGALLYISQTRDIALGGAALFAMALGMGAPLIALGVSEGALLPKAGAWMTAVKKFFGVLLLAVAVWVVSPVIPGFVQMLLWAALLVGSGMLLHAIDPLPAHAPAWRRLGKALGLIALVAGVALLVGAFAGSRDPLRPLAGLTSGPAPGAGPMHWTRVASLAELENRLHSPGKPVMLDFYADWCVSCKQMEASTFSDPRVRETMRGMLVLQADVTANSDQDKLLLKRFSLFGPPGIVFFDAQGREIKGLRVIGFQDADRFLKSLSLAAAP